MPSGFQLAHAFEQHEKTICTSKFENHFHQDDFECKLCHLLLNSTAILLKETFSLYENKIIFIKHENYEFLTNYQQLFFPLRGPPFFNFS